LVIFVDIFSLFTIALFVLFILSAGQDEDTVSASLRIYELRIERPKSVRDVLENLPLDQYAQFEAVVTGSSAPGVPPDALLVRSMVTHDGLTVVIDGEPPDDAELTFYVRRVLDVQAMASGYTAYVIEKYPRSAVAAFSGLALGRWEAPRVPLQ
jgi:hypothetical protein